MRAIPTLIIVIPLFAIAYWLSESNADACEKAGGISIRNALGEYSDCLPK